MTTISGEQRLIGALGLAERLPALAVAGIDLRPGRTDEDPAVVATTGDRLLDMVRHRQARQSEIAGYIGNAAVEKHPLPVLRPLLHLLAIAGEVGREHQLGKKPRIAPGDSRPADSHLILDDAPASLRRRALPSAGERCYQRRLARTGTAGDDEEPLGRAGRHVASGHGSVSLLPSAMVGVPGRRDEHSDSTRTGDGTSEVTPMRWTSQPKAWNRLWGLWGAPGGQHSAKGRRGRVRH